MRFEIYDNKLGRVVHSNRFFICESGTLYINRDMGVDMGGKVTLQLLTDIESRRYQVVEKITPTNKQSTPFVKCDDCDEIADYHYCSECMDNHRN